MEHIQTDQIGGHTIEFYQREGAKGRTHVIVKIDGEYNWTEHRSYVNALTWARAHYATPKPTPAATVGHTGWSKYSGRRAGDQAGGYISGGLGLTSPATARGECHYCGQTLNRRGECEECR